jgi:hypothetical protein
MIFGNTDESGVTYEYYCKIGKYYMTMTTQLHVRHQVRESHEHRTITLSVAQNPVVLVVSACRENHRRYRSEEATMRMLPHRERKKGGHSTEEQRDTDSKSQGARERERERVGRERQLGAERERENVCVCV